MSDLRQGSAREVPINSRDCTGAAVLDSSGALDRALGSMYSSMGFVHGVAVVFLGLVQRLAS